MKGYKGFNKGLVCMGKQYSENTVFTEPKAELCKCGIHFCLKASDVLNYYPLIADDGTMNEFCEVEALEKVETKDDKSVTTKLKIGKKLSLPEFIEAINKELFGDGAKLASSGYGAKLASSGDGAKLASSGYVAKLVSSGDWAQLASSGDGAQLASSGDGAQLASSGDGAKLASSGYGAKLVSSGDWAQLASSGYGAKLVSSGDGAQLASSGYGAKLVSSGDGAVVCGIGVNNIAKASAGSWITLAEYNDNWHVVCVKTEYVDGERIKADTFYKIEKGEFVEVKQECEQ